MVPRRPHENDQRPLEPEELSRLRTILPYIETLQQVSISRERWKWLRSLSGSTVTWAVAALALFAALKEEIVALFKGAPQ